MTNGRVIATGITAFFILGYMSDGLDWAFILVGGFASLFTVVYWIGVVWDALFRKKRDNHVGD